jgi:hypothetical protein
VLILVLGVAMFSWPFSPWWPSDLDNPATTTLASTETPTSPSRSTTLPATTSTNGADSTTATPEAYPAEAEEGLINPPMSVEEDPAASGGKYVSSPTREEGAVTLGPFLLDGGKYVIEACGAARDFSSDSMYVTVDHLDARYYWDFFEDVNFPQTEWACELVSARCDGTFESHQCDPLVLTLEAGRHTFTFEAIEPYFALDRVEIRSHEN